MIEKWLAENFTQNDKLDDRYFDDGKFMRRLRKKGEKVKLSKEGKDRLNLPADVEYTIEKEAIHDGDASYSVIDPDGNKLDFFFTDLERDESDQKLMSNRE